MAAETDRHFWETFFSDLSSLCHILGLKPLGALSDLIGHLIVFAERLETFCLYGRVVDKYVLSPVIWSNKSEPF